MSKPGTRFFIGPLTPAQQRRRLRSRRNFHQANLLSDARNMPMREAFIAMEREALADYADYVRRCQGTPHSTVQP